MSQSSGPLLEGEAWRQYADIKNEENCLDKYVEMEVCHKGYHHTYFGRLMRIAREELDGVVVEAWKTLPTRSDPIKVQVFLPKGETLATYMDDVKYSDTKHGGRMIRTLSIGSLVALDIAFLMMLVSGAAVNFDLANPYFLIAVTAMISVALTAMLFGKTRFCKSINLECCDPDGEKGDCHVCVVTHSGISPVTEQVGALVLCKDLFVKAQENMRKAMSRQQDVKDIYIAHLESDNAKVQLTLKGAQSRHLNRLIGWTFSPMERSDQWKRWVGIAVVAGALLVGILAIAVYLKG